MAVGSEGLAVNPGLGDSVGGLLLGQAEHLGDNGGRGDLHEHNVVETDLVEGVEEGEAALDLVCLDHSLKDLLDGDDLAVSEVTAGAVGAGDPVGDGENGAQVVGWMTPLSGQPAVVVIEPSDHGTNVEGGIDWVQLEWSSRDLGTVGDDGALDNWAEKLGALLESETLKSTS